MNITRNAVIIAAATAVALFASVPQALAQPPNRSPAEIDQLVGPIALYPDPLVSVVLPASTLPDEIQQAAQVVGNGDIAAVDNQSWDDSVRAVAHYPDLVEWMSDNIDWTAQLGVTFANQPADVLNSVQRLRARARAVGTLVDTPQQRVVIEGDLIAIVPAEPNVIYVPRYDPAIVYVDHPRIRGAAVFGFSVGFATGAWLTYDFDWRHHSLFVADRSWAARRDCSRPSFAVAVSARDTHREWRPAPNRTQVNINISRNVVTQRAMTERTTSTETRTDANRFGRAAQPTRNSASGTYTSSQPVPPSQNPSAAISAPTTSPQQPNQAAPTTTPDRTANMDQRRADARNEQLARDRERERERATESNRGAISQNPERPNVAPQPTAPSQGTPPPPKVTTQPPAGALSANEQQRREREREQEQERERANANNEPARRPTPRGSITAGSTGEYPPPPETKPMPNERARTANTPNPSEDRSQRPAVPPGRERAQQQPTPPATRTPASTPDKNAPTVQPQPESEEEKARKQKEEEEKKKKKKPDDSGGA